MLSCSRTRTSAGFFWTHLGRGKAFVLPRNSAPCVFASCAAVDVWGRYTRSVVGGRCGVAPAYCCRFTYTMGPNNSCSYPLGQVHARDGHVAERGGRGHVNAHGWARCARAPIVRSRTQSRQRVHKMASPRVSRLYSTLRLPVCARPPNPANMLPFDRCRLDQIKMAVSVEAASRKRKRGTRPA